MTYSHKKMCDPVSLLPTYHGQVQTCSFVKRKGNFKRPGNIFQQVDRAVPLSFKVGVAFGGETQRQCHFALRSSWPESLIVFKTICTCSSNFLHRPGHQGGMVKNMAKRTVWVKAGDGGMEQKISEHACIVSNIVNIL